MVRSFARWAAVLLLLAAPARAQTEAAPAQGPILVTFDLHMDPMGTDPERGRELYRSWLTAAEWLLGVVEPRGAKLSFSTVGQFAEFSLEDRERSFPIVRRLYESGGSVGTHSHTWVREEAFRWTDVTHRAALADSRRVWADDVGMVDRLVAAVFDLDDPTAIRGINNLRGTHLPGPAADRQALFAEYGFRVSQAGPGEDFVAYFDHYMYHPFRPSSENELAEDRRGPVVLTQAGPVLGQVGVHKGVEQDMSLPRIQARFLGEVLCWLHDLRTGAPERVWCFGWGSHGSDVVPRGVSRRWVEPALDWFDAHFAGRRIGGAVVARYSSYAEEAELYEAWEKAHPDLPSRCYPERTREWAKYPWLVPVAAYLWGATYVEALRSDETVQIHRLEAPEELGGPYPIVVVLPAGAGDVTVDLSAVDPGEWTAIDPASGERREHAAASVAIPASGAILVPGSSRATLADQEKKIDQAFPPVRPGADGGRPRPGRRDLMDLDADGDGKVSREEFPGPDRVFRQIDADGNGSIDPEEAKNAPPPPGEKDR
ncbi:MAG: hypothetical protein HY720_00405 [Planctomycetes bacterium]|nr:hypothetical protein [Planctomycetota bacterium]